MAAFRKLKDDEGATLQDNYRFIRPKAGRTVYRYVEKPLLVTDFP